MQSRLSIARGSAAARLPKLIGALLAGISLGAVTAHAQDATWKAAPATNNWNAGGNWTPDSVPTGTANFGASNTTTLTFSTASTSIGTIRFDAGAPAYTFNILGNKNLDVTGAGIVNNSGNAPTFNLDTQLEAGAGRLRFFNSSTAGNATILGSRSGGPEFFNTSTAGTSKIFVNLFGNAIFHDSSTAGNATIGAGGGLFNGAVFFQDSSKAGTATISANLDGAVSFANSSSADHATISTTISSGTLTFQDNATAANATINNAARTTFTGSSKAADATINNVGGPSDNPLLVFTVDATAGNATITTGDRAVTEFTGNSSGGQARFIVDTGGIFDISAMSPSGTTAGSIAGGGRFFLGSKTLTVGSNNLSTEVSGVIGDGGRFGGGGTGASLRKVGTGTLTLSGTNTYTGATTVDGGTLVVNGSIAASSLLTVNAAGTVGGTGFLPTTVLNGSTLSPGNSIGTININGNLTFVGPGTYLVEVSPTAADRTNVTGTAALAGTLQILYGPGAYTTRTYTLLSAAGGLSGTFGSVVQVGAPAVTSEVTYTNTDVLLTLTLNFNGITGTTGNQQAVAGAIQNAFNATGTLPAPFFTLAGLPNKAVQNALAQASGEIATGIAGAAFRSMDQFLNLMLDPFLETRLADGSLQGRALGFASEQQTTLPGALSAYAGLPTKAPTRASFEQRWTVWGAAAGATGQHKGDATAGSSTLDVRGGIFAAGLDYRVSPDTVIGLAVAGGSQTFGLDGVQASGRSDSVQGGVYGSTRFGSAYLSAAAAYARHDVATERNVAFTGMFDRLTADYGADSFGGRIEGGYRIAATGSLGITPYAAVQAQRLQTPNYGEVDRTGILAFALNYAGQSWNDTRSELGARADYRVMMDTGALLTLRGRAAWAHDYDTGRMINAVFQALPGFGFTVAGASPAADSALVSAGAELKFRNGVALRAKFDGEFSDRSNVYGGSGGIYVSW